MNKLFLPLILSLVSATGLCAQDSDEYFRLVESAKKGETVDYAALRLAYTKTRLYMPYGRSSDLDSAKNALRESRYSDALRFANVELARNFTSLDGHHYAYLAQRRLNDTVASLRHQVCREALLKSILQSGDGSLEAPIVVISANEEVAVIEGYFNLEIHSQMLKNDGGHSYDVITARDPKTNEEYNFHFQTDHLFEGMRERLEEK